MLHCFKTKFFRNEEGGDDSLISGIKPKTRIGACQNIGYALHTAPCWPGTEENTLTGTI